MAPKIEAGRVKGPTVGLICPRIGKLQTAPSSDRNFLSSFAEKSEDVSAALRMMAQCGARVAIELGSADSPIFSTFSTLLLSDARFKKVQYMPALGDRTDDWKSTLTCLAKLCVLGVSVNWKVLNKDYKFKNIANILPTYPFQREEFWL